MPDYSRKRFGKLKTAFDDGIILFLDDSENLWTYDDDAIALAENLEIKVKKNKNGKPTLSLPKSDLEAMYDLEDIEDEEGMFFLPYAEESTNEEKDEPIDPWVFENKKLPSSALVRVKLMRNDSLESMIVVTNQREQNGKRGVYWVERTKAIRLLNAIHTGNNSFSFDKETYTLLKIHYTERYYENKGKLFHFLDGNDEPKTVIISKLMTFGDTKKYEPVTALFYRAGTSQPEGMTVFYSYENGNYYVNASTYEEFRRKFGLPYVKLESAPGEPFTPPGLKDKSDLYLYGYNASSDGPGTKERQDILARLTDYGLMSKGKIIDHISFLLFLSEGKYGMDGARKKWGSDLLFINTYNRQNQRAIWLGNVVVKK